MKTPSLKKLFRRPSFSHLLAYFLLVGGLSFVFFPFRGNPSSIFDFFSSAPEPNLESLDLDGFSRIPVLRGGRVKPLDSVARNALLVLRNKRTALDQNNSEIPAIEWMAKVLFSILVITY